MNKVILIGRLTKDPDLRYTPNGTAVCNVTVAINRMRTKDGGQEADFVPCVVWGKGAENLAQYVKKGNQVAFEGRIQTRNYDDDAGKRHYTTEVVVDRVEFIGSRGDGNQTQQQDQRSGQPKQQGQAYGSRSGQPIGQEIGWDDDDLPF